MITQFLIDFFVTLVQALVSAIPPLPGELQEALDNLADGGATLGSMLARFGIIAPWDTFTLVLGLWVALIGFWAYMMLARAAMWALGR